MCRPDRELSLAIRPASSQDVEALRALWQAAAVEPGHTDDAESIERLLRHDAGALLVAEANGKLVGSVIAAWDGWRGSIYRLAVAPAFRRRGLGGELLAAAEARLVLLGAKRLQAIVVEDDPRALPFWRASDWAQQDARLRFVKG